MIRWQASFTGHTVVKSIFFNFRQNSAKSQLEKDQKSSTLPRSTNQVPSKKVLPKSLSSDLSRLALTNSANQAAAASRAMSPMGSEVGSTSSRSTTSRTSKRRPKPKAMSASLEIWEIQKELKRGEMVQVSIYYTVHTI